MCVRAICLCKRQQSESTFNIFLCPQCRDKRRTRLEYRIRVCRRVKRGTHARSSASSASLFSCEGRNSSWFRHSLPPPPLQPGRPIQLCAKLNSSEYINISKLPASRSEYIPMPFQSMPENMSPIQRQLSLVFTSFFSPSLFDYYVLAIINYLHICEIATCSKLNIRI